MSCSVPGEAEAGEPLPDVVQAPDDAKVEVPKLNVSYKPQKISPKFSVRSDCMSVGDQIKSGESCC